MDKTDKIDKEALLQEQFTFMKRYEDELYSKSASYIAGVDEVGRGPLAGPVVASAVILPKDFVLLGINDSKKLSEKKRENFFETIMNQSLAVGIGIVDNFVIDEINILEAAKLAMTRAIYDANKTLENEQGVLIDHLLIDAVVLKNVEIPQTSIVKGDENSISVAAASIVAKVTRDKMMLRFHEEFPYYNFDKNKGYGTKAHYEGIASHGICEIHRRSFLKNLTFY
jgi:ribonuclease HII